MLTKTPGTMLSGFQPIPLLTSVSAIKSDTLNPDEYPIVRLRTNARDQEFEWVARDYSTRVAADVYNGRYIKKDAVSAADGAWVALPKAPTQSTGINRRFNGDVWHTAEFDVPTNQMGEPDTDASPYLAAMFNVANIDQPGVLELDNGVFSLYSALPEITQQMTIRGRRNRGHQDSILMKLYAEADPTRGVLSFTDVGITAEDLDFAASGEASGGSAISFIQEAGPDVGPGDTYFNRLYVSMGDGVNYDLYINGEAVDSTVDPVGKGYRVLFAKDCQWFGCAITSVYMICAKHMFFSNNFIVSFGGSGAQALRIHGQAENVSDDIQIGSSLVSGDTQLDYVQRSTVVSPVNGNITNTANVADFSWYGSYIAGTVQSNWTGNSGVVSPA